MSMEQLDEMARQLDEFAYRETNDPDDADHFYKVEKWDVHKLHIDELIYVSDDLSKARAISCADPGTATRSGKASASLIGAAA